MGAIKPSIGTSASSSSPAPGSILKKTSPNGALLASKKEVCSLLSSLSRRLISLEAITIPFKSKMSTRTTIGSVDIFLSLRYVESSIINGQGKIVASGRQLFCIFSMYSYIFPSADQPEAWTLTFSINKSSCLDFELFNDNKDSIA